jgi:hypothetical protein
MATVSVMRPRKRPNPERDRIEIRADPEWIDRVVNAANRLGLSVSAYIRLAVNRMLGEEFSEPHLRKREKR